MGILKKILLFGCVLILGLTLNGCSKTKPVEVEGETLLKNQQVSSLMPMISMYVEFEAVPNCKKVEVINTKVTKKPSENQNNSTWEEVWTVNACEKTVELPIKCVDDGKVVQTVIKEAKVIK